MDTVTAVAIPLAAIAGIGWVISALRVLALHQHLERTERDTAIALQRAKEAQTLGLERMQQEQYLEREQLRALLIARTIECDTAHAHVHRMRVEVVSELYRRLTRVQRLLDTAHHSDHFAMSYATDAKQFVEMGASFLDYFDENRVWLDEALCDDIAELGRGVRQAWTFFAGWASLDPTLDSARLQENRPLAWRSAWYSVSSELPQLRRHIESRMRELLTTSSLPPPIGERRENGAHASGADELRSGNGAFPPPVLERG